MKRVTLSLPLLVLAACANGEPEAPSADWLDSSGVEFDRPIPTNAEFHPTRVIVGFKDMDRPRDLLVDQRPLRQIRDLESLSAAVYEVEPGASVVNTVEAMRATGKYRWVEPDYVREAFSVNDPYFGYQWHMSAVQAEAAWTTSTGSGVVVAVIDTGVSSGPSDGVSNIGAGYDFVNNDSDASDDQGHGTHVAGTIAQVTNNGAGVAGLAYDATIMPIKVLDANGSGYVSDTVAGINWAVNNGADVINMSLGSNSYSASEAAAVANAYNSGVFVAAASGNEGRSSVGYPAAYPGAVAVGATGYGDYVTSYSNTGSAMDLVAPGGDTSVDYNGDGYIDGVLQETFSGNSWSYYFFDGTSMATPHVAAAAALLMAEGATHTEAEDALVATATDIGSAGWDTDSGHGLIQVADALAYYAGSSTPTDSDGDGYDSSSDCDDGDASVYPGAPEVCDDGIDQDCDGYDEACPAVDNDGDGYDEGEDCDDGDASINPGAAEVCEDGIDQDCDGYDEACPPVDNDGDGWDEDEDCDDSDASINPGAAEVCEDGIDQDCDGYDDTCAVGPTISNVSHYAYSRRWRVVEWTTDVDTYGEVCNDRGNCYYTSFGTYHWGYVRNRGSSLTIVAMDANGATDTVVSSY